MDRLDLTNTIWFLGWLIALAVLFVLGLRLPLQPSLRRLPAFGYVTGIVIATLGLLVLANVALVLHDAHFDLTREGVFTPSKQAESVVDHLSRDVKLTYFYQSQDQEGRRAKDMIEVLGRRNARLHVRTVDPDKQPTVADTYGVRIYNAAVLETDGRRIQVMSTDENQIALGILRVIRQQVTTVCFMEGHNEYPVENFEFHRHFEGVAGHSHGEGASAIVQMRFHGVGRMRRALESFGYDVRKIIPATMSTIPADCAAVLDVNPRATYLPGESDLLLDYLARGGAALEGAWPEAGPGSKPFRLVVVGDGDFASNSFLPYMANSDLALAMVRWAVREEHAPTVAVRMPVPRLVLLTKSQMQRIFLAIEVVLPLCVVVTGVVVWWRRR